MLPIPIINHDTPSNSEYIAFFIHCFTKQSDLVLANTSSLGRREWCVVGTSSDDRGGENTAILHISRMFEYEVEEAVGIIFFGWTVGASRCSCR